MVLVVLFVVSEGNPRHLTKRDVGYNFDCEYLYDDINIILNRQCNRLIFEYHTHRVQGTIFRQSGEFIIIVEY